MSVESVALILYVVGGACAIAGPALAVARALAKYRKSKAVKGAYSDVRALIDPATVRASAAAEALWSAIEFALVGLGVAAAAVASILLIQWP